MTEAAGMIARDRGRREPAARRSSSQPRPGWVLELILAVLASSNQALRPQEVIRRAELMHGHRLVRIGCGRTSSRPSNEVCGERSSEAEPAGVAEDPQAAGRQPR